MRGRVGGRSIVQRLFQNVCPSPRPPPASGRGSIHSSVSPEIDAHDRPTADHAAVPQVTFTDPEVASVGLSSAEAEKAGIRTRVVDYDISGVAGATIASDSYVGKARMVVDEDRKVLVGATFVGLDVGELLHSATIAIVGEVTIDRLWHAVPSYPTLSEVWLRLLETYGRPTE